MGTFWASVPVHLLLGFVAALPVVLWDWRIALPGILLVQLGTSVLVGTVYGLAAPWPAVHFGVQVLACMILLLSILQTSNVQVRTSGEFSSRLFRMLILGVAALMVWRATEGLELPRLEDATKVLFIWFAAIALITLGMTETALFGSIGLLMWLIPVQAFLSVLFPVPAVIVLLGILQILVALACSFLLLAEDDALSLIDIPSTDSNPAAGVHRRHSIASGARVLGYGIGHWAYTLVSRLRNTEARNG